MEATALVPSILKESIMSKQWLSQTWKFVVTDKHRQPSQPAVRTGSLHLTAYFPRTFNPPTINPPKGSGVVVVGLLVVRGCGQGL